MLRLSSLLAVLFGSFLAVSAVQVPTTYCQSARDLINIPGSLEADAWPPALGSTVNFQLHADVDSVVMHSSFKVNETATPVNGVTALAVHVPKFSHTGLYQISIHGTKADQEVYCVEAKWQLHSTTEDRGTDELWQKVSDRIKDMNAKRADILREARETVDAEELDSSYIPEFDAKEIHEHMLRTHDEVHARYPHMMQHQRVRHTEQGELPVEIDQPLEDGSNPQ